MSKLIPLAELNTGCEACGEPTSWEYCQDCCREHLGHVHDDSHECTACGVNFAEEYADCYDEEDR